MGSISGASMPGEVTVSVRRSRSRTGETVAIAGRLRSRSAPPAAPTSAHSRSSSRRPEWAQTGQARTDMAAQLLSGKTKRPDTSHLSSRPPASPPASRRPSPVSVGPVSAAPVSASLSVPSPVSDAAPVIAAPVSAPVSALPLSALPVSAAACWTNVWCKKRQRRSTSSHTLQAPSEARTAASARPSAETSSSPPHACPAAQAASRSASVRPSASWHAPGAQKQPERSCSAGRSAAASRATSAAET
mmetsp:Transcript_4798/g.11577  ORF Transcript_4798/g.11577 Transcript_4798/m.11577 type:complete len:246 (+) Transcript_4798:152-889(+)